MTIVINEESKHFSQVKNGNKKFQVIKAKRMPEYGDKVLIQEVEGIDPTGEELTGMVTFVMDNPNKVKKGTMIIAVEILNN